MSASGWTTVRVSSLTDRAAVIRALFAAGAEGVQELDAEVVTHLRAPVANSVRDAVAAADPAAHLDLAPTPDVDWSAAWRERIGAHRLGRLVVTPPWLVDKFTAGERIVIEPAMAFGTGEHETTRGVIRLMHAVIRPGDRVADLGAGSAVLSIAAARLGAGHVAAIELDGEAIANAEQNVTANGVSGRVTVIEGDAELLLPLVAPVRVVLANIISSVLLRLLPVISDALTGDGRAILSGILVEERDVMRRALDANGWRIEATDEEGAWWSATVARA